MIFKTDDGVNVLQFGTGDILIAAGFLDDASTVSFMPGKDSKIGVKHPEAKGKKDTDFNVHTRFVFTNPKSIDIMIEHLKMAKRTLLEK